MRYVYQKLGLCAAIIICLASFGNAQIISPLPGTSDTISVSGSVSEASGMLPVWIPLAGARIILTDQNLLVMGPIPVYYTVDTAYADSTGSYQFKNVAVYSGFVSLTASFRGYHDTTMSFTVSTTQKGDYTESFKLRKITAKEMCVVQGRVLEKTTNQTFREPTVANVEVTVTPNVAIPLALGYGIESYSALTNAIGVYTIIAAVGTETSFTLTINNARYNYYYQSITLKPGDTAKVADIYLVPVATHSSSLTSVPSLLKANVYPNPAGAAIFLDWPQSLTSGKVTLHDLKGNLIYSQPIYNSTISCAGIPAGTYLVTISNGNDMVNQKIISIIK